MSKTIKRKKLGSFRNARFLAKETTYAYLTDEGLEFDNYEGYEVTKTRIFFNDIIMLTFHRYYGKSAVIIASLLVAFFTYLTFSIPMSVDGALAFAAIFVFPFVLFLVLRLIFKVNTVSIYGKRSRGQIRYFTPTKSMTTFNMLQKLISESQAAASPAPSEEAPEDFTKNAAE